MVSEKGSTYVGQLVNEAVGMMNRQGCWSCAWSSCGKYFGWSKGHQKVDIVDWASFKTDSQPLLRTPSIVAQIDCGSIIWSLDFCWCELLEYGDDDMTESDTPTVLVLATGLENGVIKMYNALTGALLSELQHFASSKGTDEGNRVVRGLRFAPDRSGRLCSVGRDGYAKLWRLSREAGEKMWQADSACQASSSWLFAVAWKPDDASQIATAGSQGQLHVWNVVRHTRLRADGTPKKAKSVTPNSISNRDSPLLPSPWSASASSLGNSSEAESGQTWFSKLTSYANPRNWMSLSVSASSTSEKYPIVPATRWTLEAAGAFEGRAYEWSCVEFSKPDGSILFSGSEDGYLVAWSVTDRVPLYAFDHNDRVDRSISLISSMPSVRGNESAYPNGARSTMTQSNVSYLDDEVESTASSCSSSSLSQYSASAQSSASRSPPESSYYSMNHSATNSLPRRSGSAPRHGAALALSTAPFTTEDLSDTTPTPTNPGSFAESVQQRAAASSSIPRSAALLNEVLLRATNAYSRKRDVPSRDTLEQLNASRRIRAVCVAARTTTLVTVADDGYIRIWMFDAVPSRFVTSNASGPLRCEAVTHKREAVCLALSPDGQFLAIGSRDSSVVFYALKNKCSSLQHLCRLVVHHAVTSAINASGAYGVYVTNHEQPTFPSFARFLTVNNPTRTASSSQSSVHVRTSADLPPLFVNSNSSNSNPDSFSDQSSNASLYQRSSNDNIPDSISSNNSTKCNSKTDLSVSLLARLAALYLPHSLTHFLMMTNYDDLVRRYIDRIG